MQSAMKMEGRIQNDQFALQTSFLGKAVATRLLLASAFEGSSVLSFHRPPKRKQKGPLEQ